MFSDVYGRIKPDDVPTMKPHRLETWDEDVALTQLRHDNIADHGKLGFRACRFNEDGYCTLFREGMRAADIGGECDTANKLIAAACREIYEDEFSHMLEGIAGLDREGRSAEDFSQMKNLVVEQSLHRILMRNAEFSLPLTEERVQEILQGEIDPEPLRL